MNLEWFAETIISSIIAAAIFLAMAALVAWWKVRPVWRRHGPQVVAMFKERELK